MGRSLAVFTLPAIALVVGLSVQTRAAAPVTHGSQTAVVPREDVLPALLIEVRGLRVAMEQMAAAGPRVQLALGRVQLQEQRINTLIRRLDEAHGAVSVAQTSYADFKRRISGIEDGIRNWQPGGPTIEQLNGELKHTQGILADAAVKLQRAMADESEIAGTLATEQARWTDLNQRMEALETALGPR
jgi:chromosome segregation ATPase